MLTTRHFFQKPYFLIFTLGILIFFSGPATTAAYTITATSGDNGVIDPEGEIQVDAGGKPGFVMIPDPGYVVESVLINDISVGALGSFNFSPVNGDHTIHVTFRRIGYIITSSSGEFGRIDPEGEFVVPVGNSKTFTMIPDTGYVVDDILINNASAGPANVYTFPSLEADTAIHVVFKLAETPGHTIRATCGENGTIEPKGDITADPGADVKFTITPDTGYVVADVLVNSESVGARDSHTFSDVNADNTIHATFKKEAGGEPGEWVKIKGSVLSGDTSVCAMILANGEYMFSCGESNGKYEMDVPLNDDGKIDLLGFAEGFAPFSQQALTPDKASDFDVNMVPASSGMNMEITNSFGKAEKNPGWVKISGTVRIGDTSVCAMILANGEYMFSCGENNGKYEMEVPLNDDGEIDLLGFAEGFQPYTESLKPE